MNDALKTLENLSMFIQLELSALSNSSEISDECFKRIIDAKLIALRLAQSISNARAFND